ncbi:putative RNA-directed DNA polymerase from transposon BS [Araneus ventricosus]|uniref:Putative RNA-directed DNA polymerase from transposon BS n=1 Tax=Araneus ventricosus TaxID=182803 RepID=A0A4Y2DD30_ARAVE|nr:putative RNA-directed DNA polymerase from transposon BS [Araneus ventricosus]
MFTNSKCLIDIFSLGEANDYPTPVDFLHRTRMLLAKLMFAMCGNANYEPDDDIILESTQIIRDCLDLVIDEPSWIAQTHRKIGMIWSSTVPLMWQATFQKNLFRKSTVNSANQIYANNAATATNILLSFKEFANSKTGLQYPSQLFVNCICKSGEIFNYIFSNTSHQRGILKRLIANLREIENSFLTCSEHSTELWELIINSYARTMLYNKSKIISKKQIKENYIYHDSKLRVLNFERNHARKIFQTYRNPVLKRKLNKLNKQINKLDQKIETDAFTNELLSINATDGTVLKFVTPFKKKTKSIPSLNGPAGFANTDLEKANFLAVNLETQFTLNNITNPDIEELVADSVMRFHTEANSVCKDFDPPLPSEVLDCIKSLRINKAPGIDGINNKRIKNLPFYTILTITTIIHKIMTLGHFPTRWKTATVVPILKPGKDPTDSTSYRPISLLPSLSKISEHLILKRLNNYLKENNVLCPEQFGFREKLSTSHQLIRVVEYVTEGFANKQKTGAVFLDIQKAFDRVWQDGLIHKLIHYKTPSYLIKLIDSYLLERKFAVRGCDGGRRGGEYCIEKVRLDYYHPIDDSEEYKTYCAEYKAIETELEKRRGKRNLIPICVELNCEIRKIDSDVEDKMHDIEYNSPNRRKIAKARNLFNSPAKLIEISNKYEVLNSEEINETIEVNDNPDNRKQAAEEPGKVEKSKIPPIMLKYVKNYVDILDVIRTTCGPTENKFGNGYIKIFTISIEQYQRVQSTLKVQGFDYYLVRPIDKRPLKVVIKDLPLDHDTDVIKNCLKKHGFVIGKVTSLTQFRTRQPLPFFLVEVGKSEISTKSEEIFKLQNLNHLSITVDPYRGRKKTIQCFKCNRFNHTAELCSMTPRCLKCGQSHTTIECEIKQRIEKPICINCNQVGHWLPIEDVQNSRN